MAYSVGDFLYLAPATIPDSATTDDDADDVISHKGSRNVGLRPFQVAQLEGVTSAPGRKGEARAPSKLRVRRFLRAEDVGLSSEEVYRHDTKEVRSHDRSGTFLSVLPFHKHRERSHNIWVLSCLCADVFQKWKRAATGAKAAESKFLIWKKAERGIVLSSGRPNDFRKRGISSANYVFRVLEGLCFRAQIICHHIFHHQHEQSRAYCSSSNSCRDCTANRSQWINDLKRE